jgi:predicted O-methyltransferase YrrM
MYSSPECFSFGVFLLVSLSSHMSENRIKNIPLIYPIIQDKCEEIGFETPADILVGTLLKSLIASKPTGNFLELGTGLGHSLAWMVDGMDDSSQLTSIDNVPSLTRIVSEWFGLDHRVNILCQDASIWINRYSGENFDLIFADTWPGKFSKLEETLSLLKIGGIYLVDDIVPQANWSEDHSDNTNILIEKLESLKDFTFTKMDWSTGLILMTKIS